MQTNIDLLLEDQLIGNGFDYELSSNAHGIQENHPFFWQNIMKNPKHDHGIFESRENWYKTMKYDVLHSNGFLRLFTLRGRLYWNAQNEVGHTTPDWKIHFSCDLNDIARAWNILVALFIDMKCEIGMKATILNHDQWSDCQRGREITVYIYRYHHTYKDYMQGTVPDLDHDIYLGPELDEVYPTSFWFNFIQRAENALKKNNILSRGVADGDLPLPGCSYASLRNEAFVNVTVSVPLTRSSEQEEREDHHNKGKTREVSVLAYPPNSVGWNAAQHPNPFLEVIFFLREIQRAKESCLPQQQPPPPPAIASQILISPLKLLSSFGSEYF